MTVPVTPLAHLAHWYSAFAFLGPALLTIGWFKLQARRERRAAEAPRRAKDRISGTAVVAEYWTLERRGDRWVLVDASSDEVREAELGTRVVRSPWLAAVSDGPGSRPPAGTSGG